MPIIGFVVVGDRTSHGGTVITGDPTWTIDGQPIARIGDKVSCPRCRRTVTIVSSRFPTVMDHGTPVAYDQDMTDCGAVLYSRHNNHAGWGSLTAEERAAQAQARAASPDPERYAPKEPARFQEHFILRNNQTGEPLAGVPYTIKTGDGMQYEGETDAQGRTAVVWTDSPLPVEVVTKPRPAKSDDPYHYGRAEYEGL